MLAWYDPISSSAKVPHYSYIKANTHRIIKETGP